MTKLFKKFSLVKALRQVVLIQGISFFLEQILPGITVVCKVELCDNFFIAKSYFRLPIFTLKFEFIPDCTNKNHTMRGLTPSI